MVTADINDRVAKAKGWHLSEWYEDAGRPETRSETPLHTHWYNPSMEIVPRPDFTGTLEGVAGMLFELFNLRQGWQLGIGRLANGDLGWAMMRVGWGEVAEIYESYMAARDKLGDCIGDAYMSVFGREAANAM